MQSLESYLTGKGRREDLRETRRDFRRTADYLHRDDGYVDQTIVVNISPFVNNIVKGILMGLILAPIVNYCLDRIMSNHIKYGKYIPSKTERAEFRRKEAEEAARIHEAEESMQFWNTSGTFIMRGETKEGGKISLLHPSAPYGTGKYYPKNTKELRERVRAYLDDHPGVVLLLPEIWNDRVSYHNNIVSCIIGRRPDVDPDVFYDGMDEDIRNLFWEGQQIEAQVTV